MTILDKISIPRPGNRSGYSPNGHKPANILDVGAIRRHFLFPEGGRIVTNNAATTQVPIPLLRMNVRLARDYENVHRGQSVASQKTTALFEAAYSTFASFLNAAAKKSIIPYRNATEAINAVMYTLMSEFRDGDNVITTMMEHNSNYVPWYAMCREILPRFGVRVEYRVVEFSKDSGELDLEQMARMIDDRTKLVCCSGASNFLATKNPLKFIREMAHNSGYIQPDGSSGSYLLVDGAQLVPGTFVDVQELDADYLAFSCHKMLAPFGVGILYAKEHLLESMLPFLYGGDMIAQGQVSPQKVSYNVLPWKYCAGTPNILGTILAAQAVRLLIDLADHPDKPFFFNTERPLTPGAVRSAMDKITAHLTEISDYALDRLSAVPGITIYGPRDATRRTALVAFNVQGKDPMELANDLNKYRVESRAGCHCATLAHYYLGLNPPASCRLSFYVYNSLEDVELAAAAVKRVVKGSRLFAMS